MSLLFVLKQQQTGLAAAEAKASIYGWKWWLKKEPIVDGTIFFVQARRPPKELALTRSVVRVLDVCPPNKVEEKLASMKWDRYLAGKSFQFTLTKRTDIKLETRKLASIVWKAQTKPMVNLMYPDVMVEVVVTSKKAYIGVRAKEYTGDFAERRAHLLPAPHPTGIHPTMSRALINLACTRTVHDPFCGAGGFLIEAGLSGKRVSGGDIKPEMVKRARINLRAYGFAPDIRVADALNWLPRSQAFVTDLPYGLSTKPVKLKPLLAGFLEKAKLSTNRIVLGLPHEIPVKKGWKVRAHFRMFVHKKLTRHYYVLER